MKLIRKHLRASRIRNKSYADNHRRDLEFDIGDFVFLKVSPWKGAVRIKGKGKLSPRFVGPYEIVERVGACVYRLLLPVELFRIHDVIHISNLRKYIEDSSHVLQASDLEVRENLSYAEMPVNLTRELIYDHKTPINHDTNTHFPT